MSFGYIEVDLAQENVYAEGYDGGYYQRKKTLFFFLISLVLGQKKRTNRGFVGINRI